MSGLITSALIMALMSWFIFPIWVAGIATVLHSVSIGLFFKIWSVLEDMIEDSNTFLEELRELCDQVQNDIQKSGLAK